MPRGENILVEKKPSSDIYVAIKQFKSPLIYVLLVAAFVTFFLGDYVDTAVIGVAVLINTILGFFQERKAERSLIALKKMLTPTAKVIREGKMQTIDARSLIPGDIVLVGPGDRIPADGMIFEAVHCFVNEAILTGESSPVQKSVGGDVNIFAGAVVSTGRAKFTVTAIGMNTKLGHIASTLEQTKEEETPLQSHLAILARTLAIAVVAISLFIFLLGTVRGEDVGTMFTLAVALAVAAIPEGMVVSLTVILSVGMQRILKRQALVRRLVSAETLGSVSVLCVDKTGTLTEGRMRVVEERTIDHKMAIETSVFVNNLENPIDLALWEWVQSQDHFDPQEMNEREPRLAEIPFDSTKKYMLVENSRGVWMKGAPEILLARCKLSEEETRGWLATIDNFAQKGLRVIGLAWQKKEAPLAFIGVVGVSDPIRKGVFEALQVCHQAGITVKVVTGDYRATSEAILTQLGITIKDSATEIMEGQELEDLTVEELVLRIGHIKLFCRVTPAQKLKIVDALQQASEIVAMTGDGVNDALAIKKADIGIVLANASDVAKEEADLVLLDFNFRTIVAAIEEGRVIFHNMRKVILYLLSDAFTEMFLIVASIISFVPLPLTAIQILWINILSDGFPDLALSVEPKEYDVMRDLPRPKGAAIVDVQLKTMVLVLSFSKALFAFVVFLFILSGTGNLPYAQTMAFAIVGTGSLLYVFSTRNLSRFIFKDHIAKNPFLLLAVIAGFSLQFLVIYHPWFAGIFKTYPLTTRDWGIVGACGILLLLVSELTKFALLKKFHSRTTPAPVPMSGTVRGFASDNRGKTRA